MLCSGQRNHAIADSHYFSHGLLSLNLKYYSICCRQPEFCKWAFNLPRGEPCLSKWNQIPDDTDILITHTPPVGYGDLCCTGVRAGCVELLSTVQRRVLPKYHIFGHIHEGNLRNFLNFSQMLLTAKFVCSQAMEFLPMEKSFTLTHPRVILITSLPIRLLYLMYLCVLERLKVIVD